MRGGGGGNEAAATAMMVAAAMRWRRQTSARSVHVGAQRARAWSSAKIANEERASATINAMETHKTQPAAPCSKSKILPGAHPWARAAGP